MRNLFILSFFLFSFTSSSSSDGIVGVWLSQIKDGKIEFYKSNHKKLEIPTEGLNQAAFEVP